MSAPGINDLPPWFSEVRRLETENARLRSALLNIQATAEKGFPIDAAKLAEQCRHALATT